MGEGHQRQSPIASSSGKSPSSLKPVKTVYEKMQIKKIESVKSQQKKSLDIIHELFNKFHDLEDEFMGERELLPTSRERSRQNEINERLERLEEDLDQRRFEQSRIMNYETDQRASADVHFDSDLENNLNAPPQ